MYINKRIYGIKNEIMSLYKNFLSIKKDRDFPPAFLFILYFLHLFTVLIPKILLFYLFLFLILDKLKRHLN